MDLRISIDEHRQKHLGFPKNTQELQHYLTTANGYFEAGYYEQCEILCRALQLGGVQNPQLSLLLVLAVGFQNRLAEMHALILDASFQHAMQESTQGQEILAKALQELGLEPVVWPKTRQTQ